MKRALRIANVIAVVLVITYGLIEYVAPVAAVHVWREDYKEAMFKCDHAMRDHFIAKRLVSQKANDQSIKNLKAAELGLLDCHHYDKLRKRLISWGVTENNLSALGLEALEAKDYDLRSFVEIHEFRY